MVKQEREKFGYLARWPHLIAPAPPSPLGVAEFVRVILAIVLLDDGCHIFARLGRPLTFALVLLCRRILLRLSLLLLLPAVLLCGCLFVFIAAPARRERPIERILVTRAPVT